MVGFTVSGLFSPNLLLKRRSRQPVLHKLVSLLLMVIAGASNAESHDLLTAKLANMATIHADVKQLIVEADGAVLEESTIRMLLKKPNGFLWETVEPFPELLVTNGEWLWNYQPDLEQVVIEPWRNDDSELAAQLLGGRTQGLQQEYEISMSSAGDSDVVEFELLPRDISNVNRRIRLSFIGEKLDGIVIEARNGQRTLWRFENVVINESIDDALFVFTPPADIEVIRNDAFEC